MDNVEVLYNTNETEDIVEKSKEDVEDIKFNKKKIKQTSKNITRYNNEQENSFDNRFF